jgi:hypothetical protein
MESVRRITRVLEVESMGAVVPIDLSLPSDARVCNGLQAMVVGLFPRVDSRDDFGELSLSFNGKAIHPFHQLVPYESSRAPMATPTRLDLLSLSTPLTPSSRVTGFYRDLNAQVEPFVPYRVRLSLNLLIA